MHKLWACVTICPTDALSIPDRKTMEFTYEVDKCVACSLCVKTCPPRAMHITLNRSKNWALNRCCNTISSPLMGED